MSVNSQYQQPSSHGPTHTHSHSQFCCQLEIDKIRQPWKSAGIHIDGKKTVVSCAGVGHLGSDGAVTDWTLGITTPLPARITTLCLSVNITSHHNIISQHYPVLAVSAGCWCLMIVKSLADVSEINARKNYNINHLQ